MDLFDGIIKDIRSFHERKKEEGRVKERKCASAFAWPEAGSRNLVFQLDTGLELGHPTLPSVAFHVWTQEPGLVNEDRVSLIGPDIGESSASMLPFGKIILIKGMGFNEENAYDRYLQIGLARYDISLKGYMMRAATQYLREWSRISREAMGGGFSLFTLGEALIRKYCEMEYVTGAEVIFITDDQGEFEEIAPLAEKADKINRAMSKMMEEMSFDCEDCDYEEICRDVAAMRSLRKHREKSKEERGPDA